MEENKDFPKMPPFAANRKEPEGNIQRQNERNGSPRPPVQMKKEEGAKNEGVKRDESTENKSSGNKEKGGLSQIMSFMSNLDSDLSLILPLVLFLGKEGADEMLILALIYIMS